MNSNLYNSNLISFVKKFRNVVIFITILEIAYVVTSLIFINIEFAKFDNHANTLLILNPTYSALIYLGVTPILCNIAEIIGLSRFNRRTSTKGKLTRGKMIRTSIFIIIFNMIFMIIFYSNSYYGLITNEKLYYKNVFLNAKEYNLKDVQYGDVELRYNSKVDNYYIDYEINLGSGKTIELTNHDSCTYEKLIEIDEVLRKNEVLIRRPNLSDNTKLKIYKWCTKYPDNLKPFVYLLDMK